MLPLMVEAPPVNLGRVEVVTLVPFLEVTGTPDGTLDGALLAGLVAGTLAGTLAGLEEAPDEVEGQALTVMVTADEVLLAELTGAELTGTTELVGLMVGVT